MIEGSGSVSLTNGSGCGSERPKNIWIPQIRIRNTGYMDTVTNWRAPVSGGAADSLRGEGCPATPAGPPPGGAWRAGAPPSAPPPWPHHAAPPPGHRHCHILHPVVDNNNLENWGTFRLRFSDGKFSLKNKCRLSLMRYQFCGSGSGIRCLFDTWIGIRDRFFPDPGSRIPNPYFWEHSDNFLSKKIKKARIRDKHPGSATLWGTIFVEVIFGARFAQQPWLLNIKIAPPPPAPHLEWWRKWLFLLTRNS